MNLYVKSRKVRQNVQKYPLSSQDDVKDKKAILEVFIPNQNIYWLLFEGGREENNFIFFDYCKISDTEFGYVSFNELYNLNYDIRFIHHKLPISLNRLKKKYDIDYF